MSSPHTPDADPHLAAAIARAERRRATLERLTEIAMLMAEEIRERTVQAPLHPEPRHDLCRGFAAVSRAVRLTVALEAKIEATIVALRNGDIPVSARVQSERGRPDASCPDDREHERDRRESETECLVEREFEDLTDVHDVVRALSADLGIPPSPEVGRADSGLPAASRVADGSAAEDLGQTPEHDSLQHRAIPPPRARPDGGSRPPDFGGGRLETDPDPPQRE